LEAKTETNDGWGQEMLMRSIDIAAMFPEEIIDFYDCPYDVNERYLAVPEYSNSSISVYFDGLIGDDELQFTQVNTDTTNVQFVTNRQGQCACGCFILPKLAKITVGDFVTLNGVKSTIMHTNSDTTLLKQDGKLNLYLTEYLVANIN
jgi:hypothetical protein